MAANKNNPVTERQIVEQTGLTTIPGLPTPTTTPTPATEQQIAEQTGLTNILGLPNPGSVPTPTPESTSTRPPHPPRPPKTEGAGNNTDNSTKPSSENAYYDIVNAMGQKPEMLQSTDKSAGAGAANGTQYSWDKMGTDQAQNQYQQEALKAKQDALANRQTIEQNALAYQQQADMMQYANNQNAEKVGWTGGYVLDQNRQMEYLKSSIQAQMYGAMELQKYGYDSALAAARLSYDLNQKEFAHKYYQDAVNVAITEAQITGTYFSAETRDMMSQLNMADQEIGMYDKEGKTLTLEAIDEKIKSGEFIPTAEQSRALEVRRNIESWYSANGVSTTGIKTLAAWESEQAMAQQWAMNQWEMYQAALASAENKDAESATVFIAYDEKGNPIYNGTSVKTLDFRTMTAEQIKEYANSTNQVGKEQVYGYVDGTFESIILDYISTTDQTTNADGSKSAVIKADELISKLEGATKVSELASLLGGYTYSTEADGNPVTISIDNTGKIKVTANIKKLPQSSNDMTVNSIFNNTIKGTNEKFTDHLKFTVKNSNNIRGEGMDDDFDIDFSWDGKVVKNYDIDVDWEITQAGADWSLNNFVTEYGNDKAKAKEAWYNAQEYLTSTYGVQKSDNLVIYDNKLWYYNAGLNKWGFVQNGAGGSKLKDDLEEAAKGMIPDRWK